MGQLLEKLMVDGDWEGAGTGLLDKKLLHPSIHHRGEGEDSKRKHTHITASWTECIILTNLNTSHPHCTYVHPHTPVIHLSLSAQSLFFRVSNDSSSCWSIGTCITVGAAPTGTEGDLDSPLGDTPCPW